MLKLKKNDTVIIISGKYKNKKGKIVKFFLKKNKVTVSGVNVVKKHTKQSKNNQGGMILKELPIDISNVAYFDEIAGSASKIGFKILEDGNKIRISKKTGNIIKEDN